ncbi:head-tail joining protein [Roseibium sediminicola]|uniref:Uncharacterized protein n=1 Tax=Roseibium sediminicola TaxID=2933272 RepID=A0ABT0GRW6_9HYPH|nr:hypothetical protein [Roseibium sp. CAU 1639]MCK7611970.1 hypothetical protein [Roseibium sp. CAU 1639]
MRSDIAQKAIDAAFSKLGVDGFYQPETGDPVPCKVLFSSDDDEPLDFGGKSRPVGRESVLKLRAAEVTPSKERVITIAETGAIYTIKSLPILSGCARLVWKFKAVAS